MKRREFIAPETPSSGGPEAIFRRSKVIVNRARAPGGVP
jgi:hypothetical protein